MAHRGWRYLFFTLMLIVGAAVGVFLGWKILPIQVTGSNFESLRIDFKTDWVLMAAELYSQEGDISLAVERLTYMDPSAPLSVMAETLHYANEHHYAPQDLLLMQNLAATLNALLTPQN